MTVLQRHHRTVRVFVACCSGLNALSNGIGGVPLVLVDVTDGAVDDAVAALNRRAFASGVRWHSGFQPINWEGGYRDWRQFALEPGIGAASPGVAAVRVEDGSLLVPLPCGTTPAEFRSQLMAALRHLRLQEVVIRPRFLETRAENLADAVVHPRYTANAARRDYRDAELVETVFALDPSESGWRLYWLVVAARMAATETGRPQWR